MKVTILGCGRWASFHAWYQAEVLKNEVIMWGRSEDPIYQELEKTRKNRYWEVPDSIELTSDLEYAMNSSSLVLVAIVAQAMHQFSEQISKSFKDKDEKTKFVLCMKGICEKTGERLSRILRGHLDKKEIKSVDICVWVGPGHVQDFLSGKFGVMVLDGENRETALEVARNLSSPILRMYVGEDLIGTEVGAACKNIIGIAGGMLDALDMTNMKGALLARGLHEIGRLVCKMGGNSMTPYGLCCLGDIVGATLFEPHSHNLAYGKLFIQNKIPADMGTAEGVATTSAVYKLAKKLGVRMPITDCVYEILFNKKDAKEALTEMFKDVKTSVEFNA